MGEIAEGLINGDFDFFTGEYLGNGKGYPRNHFQHHKTHYKSGITKFLAKKGFSKIEQIEILREFTKSDSNTSKDQMCFIASTKFKEFHRFIQIKTNAKTQ